MDLDRGTLARIDRKLLANLEGDEVFRMVRVPVTVAKWSIWKRCCDAAGISMGRAIAALIDRELVGVFNGAGDGDISVFARGVEERLAEREAQAAVREREVAAAEDRLRGWSERVRLREDELRNRDQRVESAARLAARPREPGPKVGRNERCPCGSGLKYKRCHGLFGSQPGST